MSSMGGGGSSGPTLQQQQMETMQAQTTANLNLEENSQRKSILNSMLGTRVFRGSALSRALRGNAPGAGGDNPTGPASTSQINSYNQIISKPNASLLDEQARGSGATPAGGTGGSGSGSARPSGGYAGGGSARGAGNFQK